MGIGPWRPLDDFERAIERGDLDMAIAHAKDIRREKGRAIGAKLTLGMLPLVLRERPGEYGRWAVRWLLQWLTERDRTVDQTADVASALAELPEEPDAFEVLRTAVR
jgi:hypothetical protein